MTGAWLLAVRAGEPGEAGRIRRFWDEHPGIDIKRVGYRAWQVVIDEPGDGEIVTTRRSLHDLMDRLDEIFPPGGGASSLGAAPGGG